MKSLYFFLVFILGVSQLEASPFRCDYRYDENAGGWLKLHRTKDTWTEAKRTCELEGAELASSNTTAIRTAMLELSLSGDVPVVHTASRNQALTLQGKDQEVLKNKLLPFICFKAGDEDIWLNECGTVDDGYALDNRTGHCYKFHRTPLPWQEAGRVCDAEGARLAIVNSQEEAQVIVDIYKENPWDTIHTPEREFESQAFIGVIKQGDVWMTLDGQTIQEAGYDKFHPGEPNNAAGDEFCISILRFGQFFDDPCRRHLAFICEKTPEDSCDNSVPGVKPTKGAGISDRSSKDFLRGTGLKMPSSRLRTWSYYDYDF